METIRHSEKLSWRNKLIIAPRKFNMEGRNYYVHIVDSYCSEVMILGELYKENNLTKVALWGFFKCYSNTKGLYFNFKRKRIYIGE